MLFRSCMAKNNFEKQNLKNILIVEGNMDETLSAYLGNATGIDMAFIDGNHRKEPTLEYFRLLLERSNADAVFVFDDIHWSREMEDAWEEIKLQQKVAVTIDLFFMGIAFVKKGFEEPVHCKIRM